MGAGGNKPPMSPPPPHQSHLFLCGDFNIDLLKCESNYCTKQFVDLIYSFCMYPLITRPTRVTEFSGTLIDNMYTSELMTSVTSGILINDITDHLPIFAYIDYDMEVDNEVKVVKKRDLNDVNVCKFKEELGKVDWSTVINVGDPSLAYDKFMEIYLDVYERCCPIKMVELKAHNCNRPWFTTGLRNACRKKNHLYKAFLKYQTSSAESKYKAYKNKLTTILRMAEKEYYNNLLNEHAKDVKGTWRILNGIIKKDQKSLRLPKEFKHGNGIVNNPKGIADGFNKFFVSVGAELANAIPDNDEVDFTHYMGEPIVNTMFLYEVTEEEILKEVAKFKNKKSCGFDDIDMCTVKKVIPEIMAPLVYICNKSFELGIFPEKMKIAKVVPIFKAGERKLFTNYRPVSVLPQFSKILEKLYNNRLTNFIENHNLLTNGQYGFRNNMSTALALLQLTEDIIANTDASKYTVGVFIDLKKAFDTINHNILVKKLHYFGIRGEASSWISSYLSSRRQFVNIEGTQSDIMNVNCGVPQGSILGPTLFIMYINDICNVSDVLRFILYADDTNLFSAGDNIRSVCNVITQELKKINVWFTVNKLTLNISKTNFIIFGPKNIQEEATIKINDVVIERVFHTKFLGVEIDHKFCWKEHIKKVQSKVAKNVAILYKLKYLLESNTLLVMYNTLILPYLMYCCEIWGNTYKSRLSNIMLLQKKAIRVVAKVNYFCKSKPLFCSLKLLNVYDLVELRTILMIYNAYHNKLPTNVQKYFSFGMDVHSYNTRQAHNFSVIYRRTTIKSMCLTCVGVKLWNSMNKDMKECKSYCKFKRIYTNLLLDRYTHDN